MLVAPIFIHRAFSAERPFTRHSAITACTTQTNY